ncbi:CoA-transferase family III domain-containing protein [Trichoderma austrokoningii]
MINRTSFSAADIVKDIWTNLHLPPHALASLHLPGQASPAISSSFKIGHLAQSSIALSALSAALLHSTRSQSSSPIPRVSVPLEHALVEFKSERLYDIDKQPFDDPWGSIGGLHKTADGFVRIHDNFPCHALGTLELLGLPPDASRQDVAARVSQWKSVDLETAGTGNGKLAIYALRSYSEWDAHPQSAAIDDNPILVKQLVQGPPKGLFSTKSNNNNNNNRCLQGIKVLEMSRVIAAPVAGKTLAAHGADVLWVTSPNLPNQPVLDRDLSRGKRTIRLDIHNAGKKAQLLELLRTCDVFIQGYRPGSLASYGLSPEELQKINPNIICANLSAFGPSGPWSQRRGFDSLVQTCSGMNVSEAQHFDEGEPARALPCQALDHAGGYFLAVGVMAALYNRSQVGGSWVVDVSLGGVMKYLRSLGQYPDKTGFESRDFVTQADVPAEYFETRDTAFGKMTAVRHSASVEGCEVGWEEMPKPLGSDEAKWL